MTMTKVERLAWRECVFAHPSLTPAQKLVLLRLETFADYPAGTNARPGVALLAAACGMKARVVEGALSAGRELALIEQTGRANPKRGLAAVYRLLSTRTTAPVETLFYPHARADRNSVQPARNGFQPARNDISTRTLVQPTNPLTPTQNTNAPSAPCPDCFGHGWKLDKWLAPVEPAEKCHCKQRI